MLWSVESWVNSVSYWWVVEGSGKEKRGFIERLEKILEIVLEGIRGRR